MEDGAIPVSTVFSGIEFVSFSLLSVVFFRLHAGVQSNANVYTLESALILICSLISFAAWIYATEVNEYPVAAFTFFQFLSDCAAFFLTMRAAKNKLRRGQISSWRGVLSCAMTLMGIFFITSDSICRGFMIAVLVLRTSWVVQPLLMDKIRTCVVSSDHDQQQMGRERRTLLSSKTIGVVDDWGLLTNRLSTVDGAAINSYSRQLLFTSDEEEDVRDEENPRPTTMATGYDEPPPPIASSSRNTSDSTTESLDSFSLVRPPSVNGVVWGGNIASSAQAARPADDAAGPLDTRTPLEMLPQTVRVISFKEVLTTGGVPLIVYVLLTDRNEICVHRYGEFRALCNRVLSKFFHEHSIEAPPFPGRRVFRKLLPQAMGGVVQGAVADREFIASRASGLSDWIQKVLEAVRLHPESETTLLAMVDFLRPICHFADDADQEQVINTAVMVFSETVLNPTIMPPSPCL